MKRVGLLIIGSLLVFLLLLVFVGFCFGAWSDNNNNQQQSTIINNNQRQKQSTTKKTAHTTINTHNNQAGSGISFHFILYS
jgi:hypothetical protein